MAMAPSRHAQFLIAITGSVLLFVFMSLWIPSPKEVERVHPNPPPRPDELAAIFTDARVLEWGDSYLRNTHAHRTREWVRVSYKDMQGPDRYFCAFDEPHCSGFDEWALRNASAKGHKFDVVLISPPGGRGVREMAALAPEFLQNSSSLVLVSTSNRNTNNSPFWVDLPPPDCYATRSNIGNDVIVLKPKYNLKLIVLTYARPESLLRMLQSLEEADYQNQSVLLDIHIEKGSDNTPGWTPTVIVSQNFNFTKGDKRILYSPQKLYLRGAWWNANPHPMRCGGNFLILEDDLTFSPLFYRYASLMHTHYQHRKDLSSISLHVHLMRATDAAKMTIINGGKPFLLRQWSSWGPWIHPRRWQQYMDLIQLVRSRYPDENFRGRINTTINAHAVNWWQQNLPARDMSGEVWLWMHEHYDMFALYITSGGNNHTGFSCNWAEPGVHSGAAGRPMTDLHTVWNPEWESPPVELNKYDWDCLPPKN